MAVSCDTCGLPTDQPTIRTEDGESFYLCQECVRVCSTCKGTKLVDGKPCPPCGGTGMKPEIEPEEDEEENGYWGW